jgi:hypothetical protein
MHHFPAPTCLGLIAVDANTSRPPDLQQQGPEAVSFKLCQYSGIQIPKSQKPHPPKTGLKIGIALYPL